MYIIRLKHWKFPRLTMLDCTAGNAPSTNPPCLDTAGFEPAPQTNMRPRRRHVHHVLLPSRPLGSWQPERESTIVYLNKRSLLAFALVRPKVVWFVCVWNARAPFLHLNQTAARYVEKRLLSWSQGHWPLATTANCETIWDLRHVWMHWIDWTLWCGESGSADKNDSSLLHCAMICMAKREGTLRHSPLSPSIYPFLWASACFSCTKVTKPLSQRQHRQLCQLMLCTKNAVMASTSRRCISCCRASSPRCCCKARSSWSSRTSLLEVLAIGTHCLGPIR